ncbi:MAG TPA: S1C family serine protease [Capsulimonadaceae bacterium]|nr:S1C family serine protease [Capsulimonadaceae bacterium]
MKKEAEQGLLAGLSAELANIAAKAGASVVRVDDGSRLTASGIVWSADGLILTTSHGVEQDENIVVELADGARHGATVVGRDPESDIALLRIAANGLPAIARAPEGEVQTGQLALALTKPGAANLTATLGLVCSKVDTHSAGKPEYIVHTDATLFPGSSGGALVDMEGRLIGMIDLAFGRGRGVALGVPILENVAEVLATHGRIPHGYLGVRTQLVPLPQNIKSSLAPAQEYGLLVVQVEPGSPAERGGLLLGDTLLAANGTALDDVDELRRHLRVGKTVTLAITRGGAGKELSITVGEAS